jgi:hypothetical protein
MRLRHAEILPRTLEAPAGRRTIQRARPGKLDLWGALPVAHVAFPS